MTVPNFMSKAFFYQDLRRGEGGALCAPLDMIRQKYPGADRVKKSECNFSSQQTQIMVKYITTKTELLKKGFKVWKIQKGSEWFFTCILPVSSSKSLEDKSFTLLKPCYLFSANFFVKAIVFFELFKAIPISILLSFRVQLWDYLYLWIYFHRSYICVT